MKEDKLSKKQLAIGSAIIVALPFVIGFLIKATIKLFMWGYNVI